jgi:hypothetical protein
MATRYFLVHEGQVLELNEDTFIVPVDEARPTPEMSQLLEAGDQPGLTVMPAVESLDALAETCGCV